ncbi:hypothetical protein BDV12DRAFT_192346 [Aspergillus spectabilis]
MEYNGEGLPNLRMGGKPTPCVTPSEGDPEQEFLGYPGSDLAKVGLGGKLPPILTKYDYPDSYEKKNASPVKNLDPPEHIEDVEMEEYFPERQCESPEELPEMEMPIIARGGELGLPSLNKELQSELAQQFGGNKRPFHNRPKIYIGDASPTPRWLIRPATRKAEQGSSSSDSPPLGKLRWEFDPGAPNAHGQNRRQLREYAQKYLRNSLCDPIVRHQLREMIRNGQYAAMVQNVEDPLPIPPPPPHFKDRKPTDFAKLRPPISASAPDDYFFRYAGYERPALTQSYFVHPPSPVAYSISDTHTTDIASNSLNGSDQSYQASSNGSRGRASTSSSGMANAKEYSVYDPGLDDDNEHHFKPGSSKPPKLKPSKDKSTLLQPPRRAQATPKRQGGKANIFDLQTLDDLTRAAQSEKKKREKKKGKRSDGAWKPGNASEVLSEDEALLLPALFRRDKRKGREMPPPAVPEKRKREREREGADKNRDKDKEGKKKKLRKDH